MRKLEKAKIFINHLKRTLSNHDLITFQEEIEAIEEILEGQEFKMKKIITENPKGMVEHMHNFVLVKDRVVYVRLGDEEISLVDYIRKMDKEIFNIEHDDDYCNAEDFAEYMDEDRFTCTMYHALVGFAEVRNYLEYYEERTDIDKAVDINVNE